MQRTSKRLGIFAIVACVVAVLAFGGAAAYAAGSWWTAPEGGNTLTVDITNNDVLKEDIMKANVVVDVYQVATGEADDTFETFNYTMVSPFAPTDDDSAAVREALTIKNDPTNDDWDAMAEAAVGKIASTTPSQTVAMGTGESVTFNGLADGLFLVVAHGQDKDALYAESPTFGYTFKPILVAIPGKGSDGDGAIRTDDSYGDWLTSVNIALKPAQEPLYGSLRIVKSVDNFYGEPATFVFHIQSTSESPYEYDNYATVDYSGGTSNEKVVEHIKAGTVVTVTEVYEGGRFEPVGTYQNVSPGKAIVADSAVTDDNPIASVSFANHQTTDIHGHGLENKFTLTKTGEGDNDWDWVWTALPEDAVTDEPQATE